MRSKSSRQYQQYHLLPLTPVPFDPDPGTRQMSKSRTTRIRQCLAPLLLLSLFGFYIIFTTFNSNRLSYTVDYEKTFEFINANTESPATPVYLIDTPSCSIPEFALFDHQTRPLFEIYREREYTCPQADWTVDIHRINFTSVCIPPNFSGCTAREILRDPENEGAKYGRMFTFESTNILDFPTSPAVEIACQGQSGTRIIPLIPKKTPLWSEQPNQRKPTGPNILAIGIDSISRLNFFRHFNRTASFLQAHSFEGPLLGLHKVGDNTWPNLIAMFTGIGHQRVEQSIPTSGKLDFLPLIFKEYSRAGYMTTYIEDMPDYGLWTYYGKSGFLKQPIDYWFRPVNIRMFKDSTKWFCYKEKLEFEHYYDYIFDQILAFQSRDQSFFTFIHESSVTHDNLNHAQYFDTPVFAFLSRLFTLDLSNTLLLFYSDHGIRFGPIMHTDSGYQESRMPFMFFWVPPALKLKDSNGNWMDSSRIRQILRDNAKLLTSQLDVHATLKHLLYQNVSQKDDELYGRSLFTPIPPNRTCEEAGIPDEYCLCHQYLPFSNSRSLELLSSHVIDHLNGLLEPYPKCHTLQLEKILKASISSTRFRSDPSKRIFTLKLLTSPNNGTIETTLKGRVAVEVIDHSMEHLIADSIQINGRILRLDRYAEQSRCVAGTPIESYCLCRSSLMPAWFERIG